MTNFTSKNLFEVDNLAADRGDGFEARFARSAIESEHLGVSYFSAPANFRSPVGHSHREQEEAYVIVSGSGRMRLDDEIIELKQWDVIRVAPNVVRAFESGPDGLVYIAVGNDRPEGGDGEMVKDFWTD
jgi:mannose-6-phosphate isomerase-like protein (cupin superfamily)